MLESGASAFRFWRGIWLLFVAPETRIRIDQSEWTKVVSTRYSIRKSLL